MHHSIKHKKRVLVFGLQWSLQENKLDARRAVVGSSASVQIPFQGKIALGCSSEPEAKQTNAYSAGAFIGLGFPNAIVTFDIEGTDQSWVCAIMDGVPVPGKDQVVETSQVRSQVADMSVWLSGGVIIGSLNGASLSLQDALDQVEDAISRKAIKQATVALCRFERSGFKPKHFVYSLCITAIVGAVGAAFMFYQQQLADEKAREKFLREMLQREEERKAQEAKVAAAIALFKQKVEAERAIVSSAGLAISQWNACDRLRKQLKLSVFGYVPQKLICDFSKNKATLEWSQNDRNLRVAGRPHLPGVINPLETEKAPLSEFDLDISKEVKTNEATENLGEIRLRLVDWARTRIMSFVVEPSTKIVVTPDQLIRDQPGIGPVVVGEKMPWRFSSAGFNERFSASGFVQVASTYNAQLTSVTWNQPSRPEVTVDVVGAIYVSQN